MARLLGQPTDPGKKASAVYDLATEIALIFFTGGPACSDKNGWQVPEGTVIEVTVTPKAKLPLSELGLDEKSYDKSTDPHNTEYIKYTNKEAGKSVVALGGSVQYITYFPASGDARLKCQTPNSNPTDQDVSQLNHALDVYGDVPFEDEKLHLDNFAVHLKEQPELKGYIVIDPGAQTTDSEVKSRGERAQRYLVNEYNVDVKRINVVRGERRETLTTRLYLAPIR